MTYGGYGYGSAPYGSAAEAPAAGPITLKPAVLELVAPLVPLVTQQPLKPAVLDLAAPTTGVLRADDGYALEVLRDSPTIYWRLGDSSGTTAVDSSGNSHDGTYQNAPTLGATGALAVGSDTAVTFDGSDQYVTITDDVSFDSSSFSVEGWFKTSLAETRIIASRNSAWQININGAAEEVRATVVRGTSNTSIVTGSPDVVDGQWHHYVLTFNGTTAILYVDGTDVATVSTGSGTVGNAAGGDVFVGSNGTPAFFFGGGLDEFAYYAGTVLSPTRVTAHYVASGVGTVNLRPAVLDLAAPVLGVPTNNVALRPAVLDLVAPTLPLINQIALKAAVLELRAVLISQAEARSGTTRDASLGGRILLAGEVLVEPVPAAPVVPTGITTRVIRRISHTYPNPTLTDGRPD